MPDPAQTHRPPAYGDAGLAVYNQPDSQNVPNIPVAPGISEPFEYSNVATTNTSYTGYLPNQFDVTNREQRTPGSLHTVTDSNQYRSPVNIATDMDTSPDGSGGAGGGQHTPSSQQNNSSHTSNTAYSPPNIPQNQQQHQNQQQQHQHPNTHLNPTLFDPHDTSFTTTTFDMSSYPPTSFDPAQMQQDFLQQSQVWEMSGGGGGGGGGTGLTPGGPEGDIMTMSDVDWNQMMEGLGDWNQPPVVVGGDGGTGVGQGRL
jgi:hypothetical protein